MDKAPDRVLCPLVDRDINDYECIENRDCVDGVIRLSSLPERFKQKEDFLDICKNCPWHHY